MFRKFLLSIVIFVVFTTNLLAEKIETEEIYAGKFYHSDAVIYKDELYLVCCNVVKGTLDLWSKSNGIVELDKTVSQNFEKPSISVINGKLAVAYYDGDDRSYKLWFDKSGDGTMDEGEINVIKKIISEYAFEVKKCELIDYKGRALFVYSDELGRLKFWHDNDGDYTGSAVEIATIRVESSEPAITIYKGNLTISFIRKVYNSELKRMVNELCLWHDAKGDLKTNKEEFSTIDSSEVGQDSSIVVCGDKIIVTYTDPKALKIKIWNDINSDFKSSLKEISHLDKIPYCLDASLSTDKGNLVIAFRQFNIKNSVQAHVVLWRDDGDFIIDDSELSDLNEKNEAGYGRNLKSLCSKGNLKVVYSKDASGATSQKMLLSKNGSSSAALSTGAPSGHKSSGGGCVIAKISSLRYIIVLALLLLVVLPWRLTKET